MIINICDDCSQVCKNDTESNTLCKSFQLKGTRNLQRDLAICKDKDFTPMEHKIFLAEAQNGWPFALALVLEATQLIIAAETVDVDITVDGKVYRTVFCPYCKGQNGHNDSCGYIELMTKLTSVD